MRTLRHEAFLMGVEFQTHFSLHAKPILAHHASGSSGSWHLKSNWNFGKHVSVEKIYIFQEFPPSGPLS